MFPLYPITVSLYSLFGLNMLQKWTEEVACISSCSLGLAHGGSTRLLWTALLLDANTPSSLLCLLLQRPLVILRIKSTYQYQLEWYSLFIDTMGTQKVLHGTPRLSRTRLDACMHTYTMPGMCRKCSQHAGIIWMAANKVEQRRQLRTE